MYYSIPGVKNAALHCKDVSMTDLPSDRNDSEMILKRNLSTKRSVPRRRRISVECHPDVLLEEMFTDTNFMSSLKDLDSCSDDSDDLYDFLLCLDETSQPR